MAPGTRTGKQTPRLLKLYDPTLSKQLSLATLVSCQDPGPPWQRPEDPTPARAKTEVPAQAGGMGSLGDMAAELSLQGWGLTQANWPLGNGGQ